MTQTIEGSKKRRKKPILLYLFIIVLVIIAISIISFKKFVDNQLQPMAVENIKEIQIVIPKGTSSNGIAKILKDNNLIRNDLIFSLFAKYEKMDGKFKAGKYVLNNGMTQEEIMRKLVAGGVEKDSVTFTIPEGFELKQIAERLSEMGLVDKNSFLELTSKVSNFSSEFDFLKDVPEELSLEGYLYPDTYEVYTDVSEKDIVKKMLSRFDSLYTDELKAKAEELDLDINQVIALASIIEREGRVDSEREIISGVFHNRIKVGMALQSCATVQYILGERKPVLSTEDTLIDSPYNTYINQGLPPGPIASPGIRSIEAAVNPADVDYKFFVFNEDETGTHTFSVTYDEHKKAKNRIQNKR
ncbi:endolytic transglycosylase MltG [Proteiniborus sp. MB09-C3]|uniref:endolytic transglycosylase MltG n=1 Tax=Proteiniborus sp. MB09-C3 TaxID=3050072 RepID=UPI0025521643|nr:endolytic transglycosylase MltG [Proteiniborus sp. MB09-C3]WIV11181.1 endolytic transglycosylase MltG [Proteiniborus sp. MB09-C3]